MDAMSDNANATNRSFFIIDTADARTSAWDATAVSGDSAGLGPNWAQAGRPLGMGTYSVAFQLLATILQISETQKVFP